MLCSPKTLFRLMALLCRLETLSMRSGLDHALHGARAGKVLSVRAQHLDYGHASPCAGHFGGNLHLVNIQTAAALSFGALPSLLNDL